VTWNKLAEICQQYLHKGSLVFIEGRIQTREWEKDGQKRTTTEIVANEMRMLGDKKRDEHDQRTDGEEKPDADYQATDADFAF